MKINHLRATAVSLRQAVSDLPKALTDPRILEDLSHSLKKDLERGNATNVSVRVIYEDSGPLFKEGSKSAEVLAEVQRTSAKYSIGISVRANFLGVYASVEFPGKKARSWSRYTRGPQDSNRVMNEFLQEFDTNGFKAL